MKPPFIEKREHHRLYHIVLVVCVRDLIAPQLLNRLIKRTFAHLGAERAGIAFFTNVEHYVIDLGIHNRIPHAQLIAERLNRT